jgi:hypothetical protein
MLVCVAAQSKPSLISTPTGCVDDRSGHLAAITDGGDLIEGMMMTTITKNAIFPFLT